MDALQHEEILYTTDYIENLPEGQRAELIDGHLYAMATPSRTHQEIVSFLHLEIGNYIRSKKGLCKVYFAPFAVYLKKDNKNYVEPDISVICDESKLNEKGCWGSPDWIIEVVSPSSIRHDYVTKAYTYLNASVREYWIIDPIKKKIMVHNFEHDTVGIYSFKDVVKVGIYEDLEIDFSKIRI